MKKTHITTSPRETQELAKELAGRLRGGDVVCLAGDLGAGKTTFAQGLLEALGAEGPYTSPTFTIVREYTLGNYELRIKNQEKSKKSDQANQANKANKLNRAYHIDAYRISEADADSIGWDDMMNDKKAVTIVEWPERIRGIIPPEAIRITFEWKSENEREITYG